MSQNSIDVSLRGESGSVIDGADAKSDISFNREGCVFLRIGEYTTQQIENTDSIGAEVIKRYKQGEWERNRVVVTEVVNTSFAKPLCSRMPVRST